MPSGELEQQSLEIGWKSTETVIQPDNHGSTRLHQSQNSFKPKKRIAGVMKHAIADHQVETTLTKGRPEKIHLGKRHVLDSLLRLETVGQSQGIDA